jgi:hypothetical protein
MKRMAASAFLSASMLMAELMLGHTSGIAGTTHGSGRIDGRITDSLTTRPIGGVQVTVYRATDPMVPVQTLMSDGSGHFRAELDSGSYILRAQPAMSGAPTDYRGEWYRNAVDAPGAMPLNGSARYDIVIDLVPMSIPDPVGVNGTVRDSAGAPLRGARVFVLRSIQEMTERSSNSGEGSDDHGEHSEIEDLGHARGVVWQGMADSSGRFSAKAAPGHSYVVLAVKQGYAPQFFDHQSDPLKANALWLAGDTAGIDFNLRTMAMVATYSVSGQVKDSMGAGVPSRIALLPLQHHGFDDGSRNDDGAVFSYSDSTGAFTLLHVPAGRYRAFAVPFGSFAPAYHHRRGHGVSHWELADTIEVFTDVTGLELGVSRLDDHGSSGIHGRVMANGVAVRGVTVYATVANGTVAGVGLTDQSGQYSIVGLPEEQIAVRGELSGFQSAPTSVPIAPGQFSVSNVNLTMSVASVSSAGAGAESPNGFALDQNYPNPFNPSTTIAYTLPVASTVSIRIFNVVGQEIATLVNAQTAAGIFEAAWNGRNGSGMQVASGVYIYRLAATPLAGGTATILTRRMLLTK